MDCTVRVSILQPSDSRWTSALSQVDHDVYHLPEYVAFSARHEGGDPIAVFAEGDAGWLLIPLVIRRIPPELVNGALPLVDATSPYGYPSPLVASLDPAEGRTGEWLERSLRAGIAALAQLGVISVFVRLHPLLPVPLGAFARLGTLVHHGDTVSVDLSLDDEELWTQTRTKHRQHIAAARRRGAVAYMDEQWRCYDQFVDIYRQTMRRVGADTYYFFSDEYFQRLRDTLGDRVHLSVVEADGRVACAGLVTEVGGIVQNHLVGTSDAFLKLSPNKMRIDFVRTWAKIRGNRFFHLGGGHGGRNDSLFEFKRGFSRKTNAFRTWRSVVDERRFRDIVDRWESVHHLSAEGLEGFFPPYRKRRVAPPELVERRSAGIVPDLPGGSDPEACREPGGRPRPGSSGA
jgi:hypothetical protein